MPAFPCVQVVGCSGSNLLHAPPAAASCVELNNSCKSAYVHLLRCGNVASILCFGDNLEREVKYFTETEENSTMMAPRNAVPYFL